MQNIFKLVEYQQKAVALMIKYRFSQGSKEGFENPGFSSQLYSRDTLKNRQFAIRRILCPAWVIHIELNEYPKAYPDDSPMPPDTYYQS